MFGNSPTDGLPWRGPLRALNCFGDSRNRGFCVHCGGPYEADDHVPSKVLLDEPYPDNLMVCPACLLCNNTLSIDEEYLACCWGVFSLAMPMLRRFSDRKSRKF